MKMSIEDMKHVFFPQKKLPQADWDWIVEDPVLHREPKQDLLKDLYENTKQEKTNDLSQHYKTLKLYASKCSKVGEITRRPMSAIPLMYGRPESVTSYVYEGEVVDWSQFSKNISVVGVKSFDSIVRELYAAKERFDMLFIKFPHDYVKVLRTLVDLSEVTGMLAIHDTAFKYRQNVSDAMMYLVDKRGWYVHHHNNAQWGLTVLSKTKPENRKLAWIPKEGPGTEMKKILQSYGLREMRNCGCNAMADNMNLWGSQGCREHMDVITEFLKNNAQKWFDTKEANWWNKTTIGLKMISSFVNPLKPYEGLINLAIHNHEYNEAFPDGEKRKAVKQVHSP